MTERWVNEHGDAVEVRPRDDGKYLVILESRRPGLSRCSWEKGIDAAAKRAAQMLVDVLDSREMTRVSMLGDQSS